MSQPQTFVAASGDRSYRLLDRIGRGGFGMVYRARVLAASGLEREVAIKVLHQDAPDQAEFAARMRDEARVLALLKHRAIVRVEDLLQIEGQVAIVMELIEGADLASLIKLGPLPPRAAVEIAAEAAWALAAAHSARDPATGMPLELIHRDIKPANVRVTPSGEVKVLDFGVAKARFQDRESHTESLSFGSWGYMAPERFDHQETSASDIYSLGTVLLESLAGVRLKQLSVNPDKHSRTLADALSTTGMDDPALLALIRRMMLYEPTERPGAEEVGSALRALAPTLPGDWLNVWAPRALVRLATEQPGTVLYPLTGPGPEAIPQANPVGAPVAPTPRHPFDPPTARHLPRAAAPSMDDSSSRAAHTLAPIEDASGPMSLDISGPDSAASPLRALRPERGVGAAEATVSLPPRPLPPSPTSPPSQPPISSVIPATPPAPPGRVQPEPTWPLRVGVALGVLLVFGLGAAILVRLADRQAASIEASSVGPAESSPPKLASNNASGADASPGSEARPVTEPPLAAPAGVAAPGPLDASSGSSPRTPERPATSASASSPPTETAASSPVSADPSSTLPSAPPPAASEDEPTVAEAPERPPTATPEASPARSAELDLGALSGSWEGEAFGRPLTLRLSFSADGSVSGTARTRLGAEEVVRPVRGRFTAQGARGGVIELQESEGARPVTYTGQLAGSGVSGQVLVSGRARGSWSVQRQAP